VFSFNGTTLTEQKLATGIGRPDTGAVRGIEDLGSGVTTTSGTAYLTNGVPATYSGTCTTTFPATIGFACGY
jgi:outer membrane receptor for Fe3+-dicitrate